MKKPILFVIYDRRTYSTGVLKKEYYQKTWISAVGVFGGDIHHLLDHYDYSSVATFECLIPEEDMEAYIKDLRLNYKYQYDKFINMLIDMNITQKYKGNVEYLLNQYCLTKRSFMF